MPKVTERPLPQGQYFEQAVTKRTVMLHHTAGGANGHEAIEWWASNSERIGTAFVIGGNGEIVRAFPSSAWCWHLGLKQPLPKGSRTSTQLNAESVGIELTSFGQLTYKDGVFRSYTGKVIPSSHVLDLPYRGYRYWQRYTDQQVDSLRTLLVYLTDRYDIDRKWKGKGMFELDDRAFRGESGIWTHSALRQDKCDCFPQPELIDVLASL